MRLSKPASVSIIIVGIALAVYGFEAVRVRGEAGGLSKSIIPAYWVDRATGKDLFNPEKRIWYKGVRERKEVCITFDDGPHPLSCRSLLATLQEKKVPAVFFVVGKQVDGNPDLVRMIAEEGHEIGNHTYDHIRLNNLTREQIYDQISLCESSVEKASGRKMVLFRPPGMKYSDDVISVVNQKKLILMEYVLGAKDFVGTVTKGELTAELQKLPAVTSDYVVESVIKQLRPGAIILLHDNPITAAALPKMIDRIREKGYEFKSAKDMMYQLPQQVQLDPNPVVTPTNANQS